MKLSTMTPRQFAIAAVLVLVLLVAVYFIQQQAAERAMLSRCVPASAAQIDLVRKGIAGRDPANEIRAAWAVRSNSFQNVWMISARIYGPGIESGTGPGVWSISGDPNQPGLTYSVDGFASQFSNWGTGAATLTDDGVKEAKLCAEKK